MAASARWAVALSALALAAACGAQRSGHQRTPAADGTAGQSDSGPDASSELADGSPLDARDADVVSSFCSGSPDGGGLSSPEVLAFGRSNLAELGISNAGPVWLEAEADHSAQVLLGSVPPQLLYDTSDGGAWDTNGGSFRVARTQFGFLFDRVPYFHPAEISQILGTVPAGTPIECNVPSTIVDFAMDDSQILALARRGAGPLAGDADTRVYAYPAAGTCTFDGALTVYDKLGDWADAIAMDDAHFYLLYLDFGEHAFDGGTGNYRIDSVSRNGGPAVVLAVGVDPEPGYALGPTIVSHAGTLAWSHVGAAGAHLAHFITVLRPKWAQPRTLVHEQPGVGMAAIGQWGQAIALDDDYLYWTTVDGFVKRIRLCGGTPEILASNQDRPVAIAVDDSAIYWLDHGTQPGTGKVMRIRKLDAPDANADATTGSGVDASGGASPDASVDAGVDG